MFVLVFLALISFSSAQVHYHATQSNVTLEAKENNPWLRLVSNNTSTYPVAIRYLRIITPNSHLMVRVIFASEHGPLDLENAEKTRMNLCEILKNDLDHPMSSQHRYRMSASFGLKGHRCPIHLGVKKLERFIFPRVFATKDLGAGLRYYEMRLEEMNQTMDDEPIMKLRARLYLEKDEPTTDSSIVHTLSPITGMTILFLYAIKLVK